jgi:hypothetical protein
MTSSTLSEALVSRIAEVLARAPGAAGTVKPCAPDRC